MSFDKDTRNLLARLVADARSLLTDEFTKQFQEVYGIQPGGAVTDLERMKHLDDEQRAVAGLLRDRISHLVSGLVSEKNPGKTAVDRVIREQAFTVLNRFAALRMAEERGIIQESVRKGMRSDGFQVYLQLAGTALGEQVDRYRTYLFCLFDDLSVDMGLLFDRFSSFGLLFPRENVLKELLEIINQPELAHIWSQDEAIGWIYQYYNDESERKKMREESGAPRNSRELAVRNQFFTPRYVVEFLTDNTLGRIWYEMTTGNTSLKDSCRYMVRRPNEIFLNEGESSPDNGEPITDNLSQDELLRQPVYIEHRPLKDPREIRLLDPACGSMHFGLYAFDLFETIYSEAWDLEVGMAVLSRPEGLSPLHETYDSKDEFLRDVPRLIIENNIHGVDIDPRATQIAGLSLWLRAQRSWKEQQVVPAERPQIRKSNIVCAEPMPGEKEMLKEFAASLKPKVLGQLLEIIFDKMQLAGEAGSLLKIEEEIEEAIEKARADFGKELLRRKDEEGYLPGMAASSQPRQASLFDFADLPDKTRFWSTAAQQILDALKDYAEHAESGDGVRRLFAEDAGKGFAFIDICRKRYDAAVMNPPYGKPTDVTAGYIKSAYPECWIDIYGAFFIRLLSLLSNRGLIGSLTSRTFLALPRFKPLREKIVFGEGSICALADLGFGVLDGAMVETCAGVFKEGHSDAMTGTFFDVREQFDKGRVLLDVLNSSEPSKQKHLVSTRDLARLPGRQVAYWVTNQIFTVFSSLPSLEPTYGNVGPGLTTLDNERFLRNWWESSPQPNWIPFAKGGDYCKFYYDTNLVIDWSRNGDYLRCFVEGLYGGSASRFVANEKFYFRQGLTYPRKTVKGFNVRILPAGHIFGETGISIFPKLDGALIPLLGLLNSSFASYCLVAQTSSRQWEKGMVASIPIAAELLDSAELTRCTLEAIQSVIASSRLNETCHLYAADIINLKTYKDELSIMAARRNLIQREIDKVVLDIYALDNKDIAIVDELSDTSETQPDEPITDSVLLNPTAANFSVILGCVFGRWDIRYATGERQPPELPDPFDPLPVCPPGMLQSDAGLPAEPKDVPADYPLRITWPGILLDDENHSEDIVTRVRETIEVIWQDRADAIEQEACEILKVKTLRDYFGKPVQFFADHLKRYSKSRRQAPIYWPLSTPSGSYTLWIYYHRLTDQSLYTCVTEFVEPKLDEVAHDIRQLEKEMGAAASPSQRDEFEKLQAFHLELVDFRDELLRAAKLPYRPNLNDGVLITASPIWKLFGLKKWSTDLKKCWESLEAGEYDWAHLAGTIWPERVVRVAHKDRSIAIAHDLEGQLWHEVETGTDKQGNPKYEWQPRDLTEAQLDEIAEKM